MAASNSAQQSTEATPAFSAVAGAHTELGSPGSSPASVRTAASLALPSELLAFIQLPIHKEDGFGLTLPVVAEAEACAEKLARYRRVALARDLYDLNQFRLAAND